MIAGETLKDPVTHRLLDSVSEGFLNTAHDDEFDISPFRPLRDHLHVNDGVVMYDNRVVIPKSLRRPILEHLHSGHQGVSAMSTRASTLVFWPGITADIQNTRDNCQSCNNNAPSQAATPPIEPTIPSTPFEQIFSDYFEFCGHHYLLAGDRLSGWVEVFRAPHGTYLAGANGLICALRSLFATFGVPEERSSDGGGEFIASATKNFLAKWGVSHRKSSAHFPQSNGRAEVVSFLIK